MATKKCEQCERVLPLGNFTSYRGMVMRICKDCVRDRRKEKKLFLSKFRVTLKENRDEYNRYRADTKRP